MAIFSAPKDDITSPARYPFADLTSQYADEDSVASALLEPVEEHDREMTEAERKHLIQTFDTVKTFFADLDGYVSRVGKRLNDGLRVKLRRYAVLNSLRHHKDHFLAQYQAEINRGTTNTTHSSFYTAATQASTSTIKLDVSAHSVDSEPSRPSCDLDVVMGNTESDLSMPPISGSTTWQVVLPDHLRHLPPARTDDAIMVFEIQERDPSPPATQTPYDPRRPYWQSTPLVTSRACQAKHGKHPRRTKVVHFTPARFIAPGSTPTQASVDQLCSSPRPLKRRKVLSNMENGFDSEHSKSECSKLYGSPVETRFGAGDDDGELRGLKRKRFC